MVRSNDEALDGAQVDIADGQSEAEFGNLAPGTYWVTLMSAPEPIPERPGFQSNHPIARSQITIDDGETATVSLGEDEVVPAGTLRVPPK